MESQPKRLIPKLSTREWTMLRALRTAEILMERDGIQELRGLAWWDDELERIREAIALATKED